jgi:hypothetical protein
MITRIINLIRLIQIIKARGNWPLIRRSKKQLLEFILCKNGLNKKNLILIIPYWFYMLKGLDVLVWRLETFGFLFAPNLNDPQ